MAVNSHHPEYDKQLKNWGLVRAIIDNDATAYIRNVDDNDAVRNKQYKAGAILTNFTALTKEGLQGLVFRRAPKINLPQNLDYLRRDATGDDRGLEQFSKEILGEVLTTGRIGLLVDYPRNLGGVSIRDTEQLRAKILSYRAENIINWEVKRVNNEDVIQWIVLHEPTLVHPENDRFKWELEDRYRLLALDDNGFYYQQMFDKELNPEEIVYTRGNNGQYLDRIPFVFCGAADNNDAVDKSPLYDIALINLGHYRNSADFEEAVFVVGQPTIFVSGSWGVEEFREALPQGIKFGSRAGYFLGENGQAMLLQANPNQLAQEAMRSKEKQAAFIGARLIAEAGGRETAEAARLRYSSQNSALHTIVLNIDLAIIKCIEFCTVFMSGNPEDIEFRLNRQFYDETADPNLVAQSIMLYDRGLMSREEIREDLKEKNVLDIEKTIEELEEELLNQSPIIAQDEPRRQDNTTQNISE